jgi:DMSO reductase anchor subunit
MGKVYLRDKAKPTPRIHALTIKLGTLRGNLFKMRYNCLLKALPAINSHNTLPLLLITTLYCGKIEL